MYRKTPFRVAPIEDVEMDLKELHDRGEKITRIYLTNGDPFVLGTKRTFIMRTAYCNLQSLYTGF